jgi:hypothetical protein
MRKGCFMGLVHRLAAGRRERGHPAITRARRPTIKRHADEKFAARPIAPPANHPTIPTFEKPPDPQRREKRIIEPPHQRHILSAHHHMTEHRLDLPRRPGSSYSATRGHNHERNS